MSNKVTMQHIAEAVGVSKYVVSKSLSGKEGVNAATRERVRQAAVKMGYRLNPRSARVGDEEADETDGLAQTIVVLLPNTRYQFKDSLYWGRIVNGITQELESLAMKGVVVTDQTADSLLSIVNVDTIQGFIGVGEVSAQVLEEVSRLQVPIVLVDSGNPLIEAIRIFSNNRECVYQLSQHLLSMDHRNIRFVGRMDYSQSFLSRWSGYKDAMEEYGLSVDRQDPLCHLTGENRTEHTEEIRSILQECRSNSELPTALVCANDSLAISTMKALSDIGLKVPGDISVTGFDNIEDAYHADPGLTTVNVEKEMMGRRAVQLMLHSIQHRDFPKETVYMPASIIHRESISFMKGKA